MAYDKNEIALGVLHFPESLSQKGYNIAAMGGKNTPQRRSWLNATTEGDKRELYGQGRPMAKDSSGNGANWYLGTVSDPPVSGTAVESRFFFEGTVTATDMSRATDAREAGRIGIFGNSNSYGASYGRVTNEALGRDLNPLGRGGGFALVAGRMNLGQIMPELPFSILGGGGQGNSVNNGAPGMGGGGQMPYKGCCCEVEFSRCNGLWWELFDSPNPWCEMWMDSPLAPCNPERHYLLCRCIANGCAPDGPGCLGSQAYQQAKFYSCGCSKFGSMTPFEGSCCGCRPGKFFPKSGGGGGGGEGPRAMYSGGGGCCGGGGGMYRGSGGGFAWNPMLAQGTVWSKREQCNYWDRWIEKYLASINKLACNALEHCCELYTKFKQLHPKMVVGDWEQYGLDPCCLSGRDKEVFDCTRNKVCGGGVKCSCNYGHRSCRGGGAEGFYHPRAGTCHICLDTFTNPEPVVFFNTWVHEISHMCGSRDPGDRGTGILARTIANCVDLLFKVMSP